LIATAGVIVAVVLWLAGIIRRPSSTPRLGFQLYSIAGEGEHLLQIRGLDIRQPAHEGEISVLAGRPLAEDHSTGCAKSRD
jgi:hypothetical protein